VRRLAGKLPAADLRRLRGLAREIVLGAEAADLARYLQADTAFHLSVLELAGNPRLLAIVADLRSQTRLTGLAGLVATAELQVSAREHLDLLDLLEAGDAEAAERLMVRHIRGLIGRSAARRLVCDIVLR
jgi:DNA-binding GntR family transcriptional regulator